MGKSCDNKCVVICVCVSVYMCPFVCACLHVCDVCVWGGGGGEGGMEGGRLQTNTYPYGQMWRNY